MQVQSLEIKIAASYEENAGQYVGRVVLRGQTGSQEIYLTTTSMAKVFDVIGAQVAQTAKDNAGQVSGALLDAAGVNKLLTYEV